MQLTRNNDCNQDFTTGLKVESRTVVKRPWCLHADIFLKYRSAESAQGCGLCTESFMTWSKNNPMS